MERIVRASSNSGDIIADFSADQARQRWLPRSMNAHLLRAMRPFHALPTPPEGGCFDSQCPFLSNVILILSSRFRRLIIAEAYISKDSISS